MRKLVLAFNILAFNPAGYFWLGSLVGQPPLELSARLELFTDPDLLERLEGASLEVHRPKIAEVAIRCDAPWEGPVTGFSVVLKDGDVFRLYYPSDRGETQEPSLVPMAESRDGIHWTKPELNLIEYRGSKRNNLVYSGEGAANFAPFLDANPAASPAQRYKALGGDRVAYAFASPDGIRWSRVQDAAVIRDAPLDSQNVAFWDSRSKQYVCYMRGAVRRDGTPVTGRPWFEDSRGGGGGLRSIRRSTSSDFLHWSKPEQIRFEGGLEHHLYTNAVTPYFRAPHLYFGFPMRFVPSRKKVREHSYGGVSDAMLMSSGDGVRWRLNPEAFLRPGPDQGNWTDRNLIVAAGIVPTGPNEMSIYFDENYRHATNRIRRAALRTDGFVSLRAGAKGGSAVSRPLRFSGRELVINYATSAAGSVRLELQDASGRPLAGFSFADCEEMFGDEIARDVHWRGGARPGAGGAIVRLAFELSDADVYAFQFR